MSMTSASFQINTSLIGNILIFLVHDQLAREHSFALHQYVMNVKKLSALSKGKDFGITISVSFAQRLLKKLLASSVIFDSMKKVI